MGQYKINKGFVIEKIEKKITIFDPEESVLYTFNETASFIFQKIKSGLDKNEIIKKIIKRYQISREKAEKDFEELISDLKKKKIIQ